MTPARPTAPMAVAVAVPTVAGTFVSAGTQAPDRPGSPGVGRTRWACVIGRGPA